VIFWPQSSLLRMNRPRGPAQGLWRGGLTNSASAPGREQLVATSPAIGAMSTMKRAPTSLQISPNLRSYERGNALRPAMTIFGLVFAASASDLRVIDALVSLRHNRNDNRKYLPES